MERKQILEDLNNGTVGVNFTKADGTEREMFCTLKNIPEYLHIRKTDRKIDSKNLDQISCYDIESKGWRSFLISSIIKYEKYDEG